MWIFRTRSDYRKKSGRAPSRSRRDSTQDTSRVLLPALNDLIDITTTRAVAIDIIYPLQYLPVGERCTAERVVGWLCHGGPQEPKLAAYDPLFGSGCDYALHRA